MSRVDDIIEELQRQLTPLEEQARNARIYLELSAELKVLDLNLFLIRSDKMEARLREAQRQEYRVFLESADTLKHVGHDLKHILAAIPAEDDRYAEFVKVLEDALAVQEAGAFMVVLECVPPKLAALITSKVDMITIGIGGGGACSGQVLVLHDMLGLNREFKPKFLRVYNNLGEQIIDSVGNYIADVKSGDFPNKDEEY